MHQAITRRSFVGLFAGLPILKSLGTAEEPARGHIYDWAGPYTTDPAYDPLPCGEAFAPRVICDGVDQGGDVIRCQAGTDGFVDLLRRGPKGEYFINDEGMAWERIRGHVVILPPYRKRPS